MSRNDGENKRMSRSEELAIRSSFELGIGNDPNKLLAIMQGKYKPPTLPNEPERITRSVASSYTSGKKQSNEDYDEPSILDNENSMIEDEEEGDNKPINKSSHSKYNSKYASFIKELDKFAFTKDASKIEKLSNAIIKSIRSTLSNFIVNEVYTNTKKAFTGQDSINCISGSQIPGGIKVLFSFNGQNVAVSAKGLFFGDEIIAIYQEGKSVKASIVKLEKDGFNDFSDQFDIKVTNQ